METHKLARMTHAPWPGRKELEHAAKGRFALNAQAVQQIGHAFLANIETTRTLRREHPEMRMKYPWRTKAFYPVKWPAQAVHREKGRVVLPMGKANPCLILPIALPDNAGACTLVWNRGLELHVCLEIPPAEEAPGTMQATVDLGEIQPFRRDHHYGQGAHCYRARHPLAQAAAEQATRPTRQKAEPLPEAFAALEEAPTSEAQGVSQGRAPRTRFAAQGHPPGHRLLRRTEGRDALHRQSARRPHPR